MSDPIEAAEQRRQQIADAIERLEAAANAWRNKCNLPFSHDLYDKWKAIYAELAEAIDDLARLRSER